MAAICYWNLHPNKLQQKIVSARPCAIDPVGECDSCSVHCCDNHGIRGNNNLFVCLACLPNQVRALGVAGALKMYPELRELLVAVEISVEEFERLSAEEGATKLHLAVVKA
jgi:hypothetical protein